MNQPATARFGRVLAFSLAAVPVAFGALRALTTGTDFRYLVTALASLAAAAAIFRFGASRVASRWLLPSLALAAATLVGGAVAFEQGAASATAVWFVAFSFGLCVTASGVLGMFSRSSDRPPSDYLRR